MRRPAGKKDATQRKRRGESAAERAAKEKRKNDAVDKARRVGASQMQAALLKQGGSASNAAPAPQSAGGGAGGAAGADLHDSASAPRTPPAPGSGDRHQAEIEEGAGGVVDRDAGASDAGAPSGGGIGAQGGLGGQGGPGGGQAYNRAPVAALQAQVRPDRERQEDIEANIDDDSDSAIPKY